MASVKEQKDTETMAIPHSSTSGPQNLALNTHKAGMEGLDTGKINEIIQRASEGSRFYQHKQKRQQQLDEKVAQMKNEASSFTEEQIKKATSQMDQLVEELEKTRDLSRTIVHVDMDMFYAAVEMRDNPVLRNKPMAVGSNSMLSTSNYAARKYGVRAAMPGFIGRKLCPELVIVPLNFTKYKQVSQEVQEVFAEYDPGFSPMSLDEAYLDITEFLQKNSSQYVGESEDDGDKEKLVQAVVNEMRKKIQEKTQLTASAGIAANTRLAKVCSDLNKPNGQYYLPPDRQHIMQFISSLPIRKVPGIGNVMEQYLHALGITSCCHLTEKRGLLRLLFSDTSCQHFLNISLGLGHSTLSVWTERDRKSISTETTFKGTSDRQTLFNLTRELCQELADEMQQKDIVGKVFTLKFKTTDFQLKTRAQTLSETTHSAEIMAAVAQRLLLHEMKVVVTPPLSLRLLGVRMSSLAASSEVGSKRQATLTQLFSQATQLKTCSANTLFTDEHEPCQPDTCESPGEIRDTKLLSPENVTKDGAPEEVATIDISKKKSIPIEHFFTNSTETAKTTVANIYKCFVCGKIVSVKTLEEFNKHLDSCLENYASPHGSCNDNSTNLMNHLCKEFDATSNGKTESSCINQQGYEDHTFDFDSYSDNGFGEHARVTLIPDQDLLCPVCEQVKFKDMASLNTHIDECLNTATISEIMQDSQQQLRSPKTLQTDSPSAQTKVKRKGNLTYQCQKKVKSNPNTLDRYFCS